MKQTVPLSPIEGEIHRLTERFFADIDALGAHLFVRSGYHRLALQHYIRRLEELPGLQPTLAQDLGDCASDIRGDLVGVGDPAIEP